MRGGAGVAQRHPDTAATPAGLTTGGLPDREAGAVLGQYLREEATAFLRALAPREGEPRRPQDDTAETGRQMRRSARRIAGTLHTFGSLTDPGWADPCGASSAGSPTPSAASTATPPGSAG